MSQNAKKDKKPVPQSKPKAPRQTYPGLEELCRQVEESEDHRLVFQWNGQWYALLTMDELEYLEDLEDHVTYGAMDESLGDTQDSCQPLIQIEPIPSDKEKH